MNEYLVGASISLAWPALSLLELSVGSNVAGNAAAWLAAYYFLDTPLLAYGVGAAVFGVTTYHSAINDPKIIAALKRAGTDGAKAKGYYNQAKGYYEDYEWFEALTPIEQSISMHVYAVKMMQNANFAAFVNTMVAVADQNNKTV
jgi:hypothetical protein